MAVKQLREAGGDTTGETQEVRGQINRKSDQQEVRGQMLKVCLLLGDRGNNVMKIYLIGVVFM